MSLSGFDTVFRLTKRAPARLVWRPERGYGLRMKIRPSPAQLATALIFATAFPSVGCDTIHKIVFGTRLSASVWETSWSEVQLGEFRWSAPGQVKTLDLEADMSPETKPLIQSSEMRQFTARGVETLIMRVAYKEGVQLDIEGTVKGGLDHLRDTEKTVRVTSRVTPTDTQDYRIRMVDGTVFREGDRQFPYFMQVFTRDQEMISILVICDGDTVLCKQVADRVMGNDS